MMEAIMVERRKVQDWAAKNAYTLIFLSSMFIITWIVEVVARVILGR